ncbi:MAG: exopolysaccharide biosynthesis polyprenyl glycosylphosphotransferase [Oscillospiraceae bacterium]|nr:exopolysaccharide biosynthesis polyprenyl glycosylphosphotransferase [Oscillospiraceae bacterium]
MKDRRKFRHLISAASGLLLIGILTLEFAYVWQVYYADVIVQPFFRRGNWVVILIYMVLTALIFKAYGCTRYGYLKRSDLIYYQVIGTTMVNFITYFQISAIGRRFLTPMPLLTLTGMDWILVACWSVLVNQLYFRLYPPRKLVIVYGSKHAADLVMKMSARVDKYMICESISADSGLPVITEALSGFDGVILCDIPADIRNDLIKYCCAHRLRAYVAPKVSDILMRGGEDLRLFDTPLVLVRNEGLTLEQRVVKRIFDVVVSAALLILLSPLLLLCAAAIKLDDGGTVFYRQKRLTRDGAEFDVLKFRSMIPNAESDGIAVLATEDDNRITKIGRILRRFRLDELPQLINILRGDMSLVGPRPERPELTEKYAAQCPEFLYRLQVKAGLTGYAQVIGTYDTEPLDKLKMDLMYIENYSFLFDIQILLMTVKTAFFPTRPQTEELKVLHDAAETVSAELSAEAAAGDPVCTKEEQS